MYDNKIYLSQLLHTEKNNIRTFKSIFTLGNNLNKLDFTFFYLNFV